MGDRVMRYTVRLVGHDAVVNLWMGRGDGDLQPHGQLRMSLRQFAFFRTQTLAPMIYEPGCRERIDSAERSEQEQAARALRLRAGGAA